MDYNQISLEMHEENRGKLSVVSKVPLKSRDDLSTAYTPGVAQPCREIHKTPESVYRYTAKGNLVAVVTDGTAVLGLGDIGPEAALPVMEGKAILFKSFADVDAFPICLDTQDVDEIVDTVCRIAPGFGGINLEDISAPRCVEIEKKLKDRLAIPIFHDDQHGTAIVVVAALINALKVVNKAPEEIRVVVNGIGAAGGAVIRMLLELGVSRITPCDRMGILTLENAGTNPLHREIAAMTNAAGEEGSLADALNGSDVFIGVSAGNIVTAEMVASMNRDAIVFAMANPTPEILPELAKEAGAAVIGTGRSDYPNQVNNVLAFPGIFRGALDARAVTITEEMKMAAACAIANSVSSDRLSADCVIPDPLDDTVAPRVAQAVKAVATRNQKVATTA